MRTIPCKELNDPKGPPSMCGKVFEVNSFEDLMDQATEHINNTPAHAKDVEKMKSATEEETKQWEKMARSVYDSKSEM